MRSLELSKRNFTEVWRDWLSLGLTIALPVFMLLVLQALKRVDAYFTPTSLAPGVALFGFVMLMFSAAMTLSRDRESALFARLLTTPLQANDFATAYSLPYLVVAIIQGVVLFAIGALLGLEINGSVGLVFLILLMMAVLFVACGMIMGSLLTVKQVPFAYMVILLLTIFGGAWMDLQAIGGGFQTFGDIFPFAHAINATRDVMINGVGFGDVATDFYWVAGYTLVTVVLAIFVFRRKMVE